MYKRLLNVSKKLIPRISETERIALNSGTKGIEEYFFKGSIPKDYLKNNYKYPKIAESSIINGGVEELCSKVNDYEIFQNKKVDNSLMEIIKKNKLFGLIIPKEYGGLELNHHEQSQVVQKIASSSSPLGVMVMVPNSLGPAELLLKYGTSEEKDKYLNKLADGEYIPCFGLTGQHSGSDAASMNDRGVLFEEGNKKYIRLNISKRYITLAPISNLIGIAFKLEDPDNLLTKGKEGITLALIEPSEYNIDNTNVHNPMDVPFPNGTLKTQDLVIPLDKVIGGEENVGNGWRMLMECLAVGRSISLPSCAVASAKVTTNYAGAYSVYRKQFKTMLADMEGVQRKLAIIGSETLKITSMQYLTNSLLDSGLKPSVISAIMKYETTERSRDVVNHGMDIVAGAGICKGPRNILGNAYQAIPIGITVEGSNTLTKNLIVFGQGLMKSHPYLYNIVESIENNNVEEFRNNLNGIVKSSVNNVMKSLYYKLYGNLLFFSKNEELMEEKLMTNFALTSNIILLLGTKFKTNEFTSGRMADIMGSLYIINALEWFNDNNGKKLSEMVRYAKYEEYEKIVKNLKEISDNYPITILKYFLKIINNETYMNRNFRIEDKMIINVSNSITKDMEIRDILGENIYMNERMRLMNDNLERIIKYQYSKENNAELDLIIDEITRVDEFKMK